MEQLADFGGRGERITRKDLVAYVSGTCNDAELRQQIAQEAKRNGSYVQQWMAEMERRAIDPFGGIEWANIEETSGEEGTGSDDQRRKEDGR